jgi:predicted TIM-barrel fold metal-dependent hydrolase
LDEAQKALASGAYKGIGEVHLWSDLGPRRDNRIFNGLIQLAQRYDVPFMIHTEASSHEFFRPICQQYPRVKFMWAHAGSKLNAQQVGALLEQCPNVWPEVSVRDPWRYHSLVDDDGRLLPGWRELMIKYQDRFMTGTNPTRAGTTTTNCCSFIVTGCDSCRQRLSAKFAWTTPGHF